VSHAVSVGVAAVTLTLHLAFKGLRGKC